MDRAQAALGQSWQLALAREGTAEEREESPGSAEPGAGTGVVDLDAEENECPACGSTFTAAQLAAAEGTDDAGCCPDCGLRLFA